MSDRDTIRQALNDAIGWQAGLVAAWPKGSPERKEAWDQIKAYRALLHRRYGDRRTNQERVFADAKTVTLDELKASRNPPERA